VAPDKTSPAAAKTSAARFSISISVCAVMQRIYCTRPINLRCERSALKAVYMAFGSSQSGPKFGRCRTFRVAI
jgi:hypothetical protein